MPNFRSIAIAIGTAALTAGISTGCGGQDKPTVSTPVETKPSSSVMTETPSTVAPGSTFTETPTERTDTGAPS
ncbi:biotin and thiamin synthesis associated [Mycolicibacterium canariasense]|uniref:Biotin and thiamin synthesis associated n=1 Tax=Mycolicibacterium canariasense TaxID=228230 RepID=A0A100WGA2_MYCCR|nr:hypothetical protein [Mycolicibacterium canariasense]MCV7209603.1 hypothetical protein [Mycolicibacterium canariasense]ORU99534.1 hypothetical protein AWB94_01360 [Mycolicibacterium canariasense]GAS97615.1 biotin and thiamin synthesis associated [Mycolicibacterium canariasense]